MKFSARKLMNEEEQNVDMTPLIDMVFILLIFFIVTTVFVKESAVEVEKPQAASAQTLKDQSIYVTLSSDGKIYCDMQEYSLDSIRNYIQFQLEKKELPVIIRVDKNSISGRLVDLIDECKIAGAKSIKIATEIE